MSISRNLAELFKNLIQDPSTGGVSDIPSAEAVKELNEKFKILQVVHASTSTEVSVTTDTYSDTGLTASITPTLSTSKIFVIISQQVRLVNAASAIRTVQYKVLRDAVEILNNTRVLGSNGIDIDGVIGVSIVDVPETDSQIVYKTQGRRSGASSRTDFQEPTNTSTITLIEVAG